MRVLVIGGMHGNEMLGIELVRLLKKRPILNTDAIFANDKAIKTNQRFITKDLNRSFPGNVNSKDYEDMRAQQLLGVAKDYDIVLDFHNTHCPDNDCGFVGESASQSLFDVAWFLGLDKVILADYDCINKYAPNCLSVEISLDSQLNNVEVWYQRLSLLAKLGSLDVRPDIEKYKFIYRMTLDDRDAYDLPSKNLKAFQALDKKLAKDMGLEPTVYPIFIGDKFTPYNYGGLLIKV